MRHQQEALDVDWLQIVGSVSSIVSLLVAGITLLLLARLRTRLKQHSRQSQLTEIIDRVVRIPQTKDHLPESTCRELQWVLKTIRCYEVSFWYFFDRSAKKLATEIEKEIEGDKRRMPIQNNLRLLRDEITLR